MNKIINVPEWLEENKVALSTPPVCNKLMHFGQLIVMFVGGGNIREDFHINEGEELFYQLKGEMLLVIEEAGRTAGYVFEFNHMIWSISYSPYHMLGSIWYVQYLRYYI